MEQNPLNSLLSLIESGKLTELQAERLLNAATRYQSGTPTGVPSDQTNTHTPKI